MRTHLTLHLSELESTCYDKGVIISYRFFYAVGIGRGVIGRSSLLNSGDILRACTKGYFKVSPNKRRKVCFSQTPLLMTGIWAGKDYR
jgi:hypothetical protein